MKKEFRILIIVNIVILSVLVIAGIAAGAYYLGVRQMAQSGQPNPTPTSSVTQPVSQSLSPKASEPLFSGSIKKINKDLGLFKISDMDKENGVPDSIVYFEAGTYLRGAQAGYTRILAIRPSEGPGPSIQFLLATKDYSSYVLDDPMDKSSKYPVDDWDNPFTYIDKNKITKTVVLENDHPKTIEVASPFKLIRQDSVLIESKKTGQKTKEGYDIYLDTPEVEVDSAAKLASPVSSLTLYAGVAQWGDDPAFAVQKKYIKQTTNVLAMDSTGLIYAYVISTKQDVDSYVSAIPSEEATLVAYKKQVALYNEKKLAEYPEYPKSMQFPGLRLTKAVAGLSADYYNSYDMALPGGCGGGLTTYIVYGLTDADFTSVPSTSPYPLFTLKDKGHVLNKQSYKAKTEQGEEIFKSVNDGKSMPTLEAYSAKNPLLFFKDAWGRWVMVGEFDWKIMGGCGKPVVYLYPEKSTDVRLSFARRIELNTNIPTYQNGWYVKAHPDGTLTDLQPQYTDCSKMDGTKFGSEYALSACKSKTYPYIYWSGKSLDTSYPRPAGGWIVEKTNLLSFMQDRLSEIGLTQKESNDMTSYWVPKMAEKNMPYYRISFIQTDEMNAFVPLQVSPQPDTVLRIFLDWKGLNEKPANEFIPQKLERVDRNGFTLVEWGGLL